jgi:hypothetical protein
MGVSQEERLVIFIAEGMKTLGLHGRTQTERDSDTELWVNLPDLGVSVFYDAEGGTRRGIGREVKVPEIQVYTMKYHEASRWEPEDMELVLRGSFDRIDAAVAEVFSIAVKDRILNMIEAVDLSLDAG